VRPLHEPLYCLMLTGTDLQAIKMASRAYTAPVQRKRSRNVNRIRISTGGKASRATHITRWWDVPEDWPRAKEDDNTAALKAATVLFRSLSSDVKRTKGFNYHYEAYISSDLKGEMVEISDLMGVKIVDMVQQVSRSTRRRNRLIVHIIV
jgi:Mg-chelatase subunit ChlD